MLHVPQILALSAILAWVMVIVAAALGEKLWTPGGVRYAAGNRETRTATTPLAGRADRAAKNMLENLVVFTALAAAAWMASAGNKNILIGANVFFWARLAYWPVYLIGVPYLRTGIWAVSVAGMALMAGSIV